MRTVPSTARSITGARVSARGHREGDLRTSRLGALRCHPLVLHGEADVLPEAASPCFDVADRFLATPDSLTRAPPDP